LLAEESNSSKDGYASSTQARFALSFKTKVSGIFGGGHPFAAVDVYDEWISAGTRKGFRDQMEIAVKALETALIRKMGVYLVHKPDAQRIFRTLLTDYVQQMLKLHRMMDDQFLWHRTVLGSGCGEGNWILSGQFVEAVISGTWRATLIGADEFSETGHTRCALYLWAALQTNRVLQEYIELDFIARPEVSAVAVVEHLIQTRVPMAMHETAY
jgi:hypothetical protein